MLLSRVTIAGGKTKVTLYQPARLALLRVGALCDELILNAKGAEGVAEASQELKKAMKTFLELTADKSVRPLPGFDEEETS